MLQKRRLNQAFLKSQVDVKNVYQVPTKIFSSCFHLHEILNIVHTKIVLNEGRLKWKELRI